VIEKASEWMFGWELDLHLADLELDRGFIFTLEGKEPVHDDTSSSIVIPAKARHTFRADSSYEGECEVHSP
jgi:hypothetical protein